MGKAERKFRDLSLSQDEAKVLAMDFMEARDCFLPAEAAKFVNRAAILLPLWRKAGLQELANKNFSQGWEAHEFECAGPMSELTSSD